MPYDRVAAAIATSGGALATSDGSPAPIDGSPATAGHNAGRGLTGSPNNAAPAGATTVGTVTATPGVTTWNDPAPLYRPYYQVGSDYTVDANNRFVTGEVGNIKDFTLNAGSNMGYIKPLYTGQSFYYNDTAGTFSKTDPGAPSANVTNPQRKGNYGFRFWYNPSNVQTSNSLDYAAGSRAQINSDSVPLFLSGGSLAFDCLINRQDEISAKTPLPPDPATGGTGTFLSANTFDKVGTLWDLEILFRVFNGTPTSLQYGDSYNLTTADFGFVAATPIVAFFNDVFKFTGVMQSVSVNHYMFTPSMVPMISVLSFAMTRIAQPGGIYTGIVTGAGPTPAGK